MNEELVHKINEQLTNGSVATLIDDRIVIEHNGTERGYWKQIEWDFTSSGSREVRFFLFFPNEPGSSIYVDKKNDGQEAPLISKTIELFN